MRPAAVADGEWRQAPAYPGSTVRGAADVPRSISARVSDSAMKIAARIAVVRVSRLAVPRPGHERAHALRAADAQPTALAALDQHDADQGQGDEQVDDQQDGAQRGGTLPTGNVAAALTDRWPAHAIARRRRLLRAPALGSAGNRQEILRLQAGAADQRAADLGHGQQGGGVGRFDRAAIQDAMPARPRRTGAPAPRG